MQKPHKCETNRKHTSFSINITQRAYCSPRFAAPPGTGVPRCILSAVISCDGLFHLRYCVTFPTDPCSLQQNSPQSGFPRVLTKYTGGTVSAQIEVFSFLSSLPPSLSPSPAGAGSVDGSTRLTDPPRAGRGYLGYFLLRPFLYLLNTLRGALSCLPLISKDFLKYFISLLSILTLLFFTFTMKYSFTSLLFCLYTDVYTSLNCITFS